MTRRQKLILILLTTVSLSPLWSFNYGVRFNIGLSGGTGNEWFSTLDKAGSLDFNRPLTTAAIGIFTEFNLSPSLVLAPEFYYVMNRGTAIRDDDDNYIETLNPDSLELILPAAYDFEFDSGKKALRVMGGIQMRYSLSLEQNSDINDNKRTLDLDNMTPFSLGFVLGSGVEFRRDKKLSWLIDMRMIAPVSPSIKYRMPDGDKNEYMTIEFLLGSGIKF